MTHISPGASLAWAVLACLFECYAIFHLFRSFIDQRTRHNVKNQVHTTFKLGMTTIFLLTITLLMIYAIVTCYVNYEQDYGVVPGLGLQIQPATIKENEAIYGIMVPWWILFSFAWSFEIITHLQELSFWFFIIRQIDRRGATSWFRSFEFILWIIFSLIALIGLPLLGGLTKHSTGKTEAWVFLAGSIGSSFVTLMFAYVAMRFPYVMRVIKADISDTSVHKRFTRARRLNVFRIMFRIGFCVPLFLLALDGALGQGSFSKSVFWADLAVFLVGFCVVASLVVTLHIFFPINISLDGGSQDGHFLVYGTSFHQVDPFVLPILSSPPATAKIAFNDDDKRMTRLTVVDDDDTSSIYSYYTQATHPNQRLSRHPTNASAMFRGKERDSTIPPVPVLQNLVLSHPYIEAFTSPIDIIRLRQSLINSSTRNSMY